MMAPAQVGTPTVTIEAAASLSGALRIQAGCAVLAIQTPAGWDTAAITFEGSLSAEDDPDDATFDPVYDQSHTEISVPAVAAGQIVVLPAEWTAGLRYLKIRSGTVGSAVAQGDAVTLTVGLRRVA